MNGPQPPRTPPPQGTHHQTIIPARDNNATDLNEQPRIKVSRTDTDYLNVVRQLRDDYSLRTPVKIERLLEIGTYSDILYCDLIRLEPQMLIDLISTVPRELAKCLETHKRTFSTNFAMARLSMQRHPGSYGEETEKVLRNLKGVMLGKLEKFERKIDRFSAIANNCYQEIYKDYHTDRMGLLVRFADAPQLMDSLFLMFKDIDSLMSDIKFTFYDFGMFNSQVYLQSELHVPGVIPDPALRFW
ncbi:hypothetical protein WICPIJ_003231 [Wickerhamomyces pijperi]|uniref:Uncharacterized protein n=1 Tax=Wickerhamomyces pijperi TaxID=599730 RepID=A0A9P8QA28_WICPI|nr:hypothetical protein WICPIJ_003231 [Wickerhamomyces pijperi]